MQKITDIQNLHVRDNIVYERVQRKVAWVRQNVEADIGSDEYDGDIDLSYIIGWCSMYDDSEEESDKLELPMNLSFFEMQTFYDMYNLEKLRDDTEPNFTEFENDVDLLFRCTMKNLCELYEDYLVAKKVDEELKLGIF